MASCCLGVLPKHGFLLQPLLIQIHPLEGLSWSSAPAQARGVPASSFLPCSPCPMCPACVPGILNVKHVRHLAMLPSLLSFLCSAPWLPMGDSSGHYLTCLSSVPTLVELNSFKFSVGLHAESQLLWETPQGPGPGELPTQCQCLSLLWPLQALSLVTHY
jgi:hypothetical protein